jgi:hypothetical protein
MVLQLNGPVLRIDKLIQDLLLSEWPSTPNVDINKLQTIKSEIDWGKDYNNQTNYRCTIKLVSVNMAKSNEFKTLHKLSYDGTADVRVQYRDVGEEQPQEIWNIGHEIKNIIIRNPRSLSSQGIMDIQLDDFSLEDGDTEDLKEYHQELKIKILQTVIDV